jgi:hypothetical protein
MAAIAYPVNIDSAAGRLVLVVSWELLLPEGQGPSLGSDHDQCEKALPRRYRRSPHLDQYGPKLFHVRETRQVGRNGQLDVDGLIIGGDSAWIFMLVAIGCRLFFVCLPILGCGAGRTPSASAESADALPHQFFRRLRRLTVAVSGWFSCDICSLC